MKKLKIHHQKRYLMWEDGTPFFYLADTAWELFHRLSREEADYYLRLRASQGFHVIQAVVLGELDGIYTGNAYGRRLFRIQEGKVCLPGQSGNHPSQEVYPDTAHTSGYRELYWDCSLAFFPVGVISGIRSLGAALRFSGNHRPHTTTGRGLESVIEMSGTSSGFWGETGLLRIPGRRLS